MAKNQPRICANCKHWECYESIGAEYVEDELGRCKMTNTVVYGDDEADDCYDFKSGKRKARKRW